MDRLTRAKNAAFVALAALAIVLAVNAPSQARDMGGHGFGSGHPGGAGVHHGFDRHQFDRGVHDRFRFGSGFPYYDYDPYYDDNPPASAYDAPSYWYYCQSYGAYYPNVPNCPEAWVPVPAS